MNDSLDKDRKERIKMNYQDQISAYFDRNEVWFSMMKDIARVVAINSERMPAKEGMPFGEGPYQALMEFLEMAKEKGFNVTNYGNAVGAVDLNDKERQLDMLAHLDIVPAGEGWSVTDPFEAKIVDGKLYGRGTADDKGPAVVALWALKCIRDLNIPVSKNARVVVGTDEECSSGDLPYYYGKVKEAPMTFSPDAEYPVINIEKGGIGPKFHAEWEEDRNLPRLTAMSGALKLNVLPGNAYATVEGLSLEELAAVAEEVSKSTKAVYSFHKEDDLSVKIACEGTAAHAASPEKGNNALTALIEYLCALPLAESEAKKKLHSLKKLFPHRDSFGKALGVAMEDKESGYLTLVFSMMNWTKTGFTGQFDCRAPICATEENLTDIARNSFEKEGITMDEAHLRSPHYVPEDSPFVKKLLEVYEAYTGLEGKCIAIGGGTYVHHLANGVAFGCALPGTENGMHCPDEFAVIDELIVSAKMFAQIIADLCA